MTKKHRILPFNYASLTFGSDAQLKGIPSNPKNIGISYMIYSYPNILGLFIFFQTFFLINLIFYIIIKFNIF